MVSIIRCRDALEHAKWIIAVLTGQIDPGPFRLPETKVTGRSATELQGRDHKGGLGCPGRESNPATSPS
jgi:hypothetical protein